ncbi:hypothetical protein OSTOST_10291, partial [Ostertagia ostertagi]
MVELAVGDLYDQLASKQEGIVIRPEALYECKYCAMFEIPGSELRDSDRGRSHAAAHRIAFEALLEPAPVLICPICDLPQKTSDVACVFGCMFNDLDLSDGEEENESSSTIGSAMEPKYSPDGADEDPQNEALQNSSTNNNNSGGEQSTSRAVDMETNIASEAEKSHRNGDHARNEGDISMDSERNKRSEKASQETPPRRQQMAGVSIITCLVCDWSPTVFHDSSRMRDEVSSHVRLHIREESGKIPGRGESFFGDKRLLSCMDFSLEEYFEKEHLTDLSGTINSRIMERVYGDLLAKLFGICVPLVYRILHGNNGNPFRPPESLSIKRRKGRRANRSSKPKKGMTLGDTIKLFEMHPFVDEERLRTRKHKSIPHMDADKIERSLSSVWLHLNQWSNDPVNRVHLASESRWIRLAQIRRRVFLESKKAYRKYMPDKLTIPGSDAQEEAEAAELAGKYVHCNICANVCIRADNTAYIKIFSEPTAEDSPREEHQCKSDFLIRCQRSSCCGIDPVIVLPCDKAIPLANVDIAVVKHMLWHVRNDPFLELDSNEKEILTRALMIRLSCTQMRQVLFMAKKVAKQFIKYKETDLIRYVQDKMEEIGCVLFGFNKGLVFQSDRRKRAFVAYAHPVVLHILEHLSAGQLPQHVTSETDLMRWESACAMEGLRFKNVSMAIKHVLDAHNDLVELSALDMMLEDMGIHQLFRSAISSALGDQAWQLEEALGFGAYKAKVCPRPDFFNETETESIHRPECTRPWDTSTQLCACSEPVPTQSEAIAQTTSLPAVKLETEESGAERSGFENSIAALAEGLAAPSTDQSSADAGADASDNRMANSKKKRPDRFKRARQKRVKEIKREVDGMLVPQRNKALPLK